MKRHYIPVTASVPGVNESQIDFIRKAVRTALAAEGVDFPVKWACLSPETRRSTP